MVIAKDASTNHQSQRQMADIIEDQKKENVLIDRNSLRFVNKKKVNLILPNPTNRNGITTVSIGVGGDVPLPRKESITEDYKYTGDMYAEKKHGKGVLSYSDGRMYQGAFFADKRHGFGDYHTPNISEFKGLYCHDERFGPGIVLYKSVDIADVGLWLSEVLIRLLSSHPNLGFDIEITDKKSSSNSIIPSWYSPQELLSTISDSHCLLKNKSSSFFCHRLHDRNQSLNNYILEHIDRLHESMTEKYAQLDAYLSSIAEHKTWKDDISKEREADIHPPNQTYEQQQLFHFINKFWPLKQRASFPIEDILSNSRSAFPNPGPLETASLNLFEYASHGNEKSVRDLLMERSVYVDVCDCHGLTSLHLATYNGHIQVINTLLDFGGNVNQFSDDGLTPLSLAFLLYYGNNPRQTRNLALEHHDPVVIHSRTATLTDSNSLLFSGQTFLHSSSYLTNNSEIADELKLPSSSYLIHTSDFQQTSSYGFELTENLRERIRDEDFRQSIFAVILVLLRRGANPTFSDWPLPVLALSVRANDHQMVKYLLKKKAQVNCQLNSLRHWNLTPLHIACGCLISNPIAIIRLLLEHGANVHAQSLPGNREYLSLLDPLMIENNKINFSEITGRTPLHIACSRDESEETLEIVRILLEYQANPNALCNGQTPLTLAIVLGNQSLVDLLLNYEQTDPATGLGFGNGNALCLVLSTFYESKWNYSKRIQLIERLIAKNPKVLYPIRFGPKNLLGSCVDFGYYMFNSDTRISQTPYHALTMEEREIYGERKDLLIFMAKRFREEISKHDEFLRLPTPPLIFSESSTPSRRNSRVQSMIKEKSPDPLKAPTEFRYCATCGRGVGVLLCICKRCQKVYFCSKNCKVSGWNQFHRFECKRITSSAIKNSPSRNRDPSDFDRIVTLQTPPKTRNNNSRLPSVSVAKLLREKRLKDRVKSAGNPPTTTITGKLLSINPVYHLPENYSFN